MATVEISDATFRALARLAESRGSDLNALVECALIVFVEDGKVSDDEWLQRWHRLQNDIQAHMPPGITEEEIEADIDAAIAEVRAERLARGG